MPDISWNEFSENSFVEPSRRYGREALQVLADVRGARAPAAPATDSSDPGRSSASGSNGVPVAAGLGVVVLFGLALVARRNRRRLERVP